MKKNFCNRSYHLSSNKYTIERIHGFMVQRPIKISRATWLISGANPSDDTRSFVPFSRSRFSFFPSPLSPVPRLFYFSFSPLGSQIAVRRLLASPHRRESSYRKRVKATQRHQLSNISTILARRRIIRSRLVDPRKASGPVARVAGGGAKGDTRFRRHLNPRVRELPIPRDERGSLARGIARFQPPRVLRLVRRRACVSSVKTLPSPSLSSSVNWNWSVRSRVHTSKASREIELRYNSGAAFERTRGIGIARFVVQRRRY